MEAVPNSVWKFWGDDWGTCYEVDDEEKEGEGSDLQEQSVDGHQFWCSRGMDFGAKAEYFIQVNFGVLCLPYVYSMALWKWL